MTKKVALTAKERKVLDALRSGLFLRRRQFSDLWEIARSMSSPILTEQSRTNALFSVNCSVVENLRQRGLIYVGNDRELGQSRYMLDTDMDGHARAALAGKGKVSGDE